MTIRATRQLNQLGQSIWLDNITRALLISGSLKRYIETLSVTGLTSNPTIFQKAIGGSQDYDASIATGLAAGRFGEDLFFDLAIADLQAAADLFADVHKRTGGVDGFVSLEVSPTLADDTQATVAAAQRLFAQAGRTNLFIKIPGTPAGIEAIEEAIFQGIPVNVTLLFSPVQYRAAHDAYLRGLERRLDAGLTLDVASVASLFVSRWDAAVAGRAPEDLANRLGISVCAACFANYNAMMASERFRRLANAGARPQRLLWASTGVKDPSLPPFYYAEALAMPLTINTMPEATLQAVAQKTELSRAQGTGAVGAATDLRHFTDAGIDIDALAGDLQQAGAVAFVESWTALLEDLQVKAESLKKL